MNSIFDASNTLVEKTILISHIFTLIVGTSILIYCTVLEIEEYQARALLEELNRECERDEHRESLAAFRYSTDMTDENLNYQLAIDAENAKNQIERWKKVMKYNWHGFRNYSLRRQFGSYAVLGDAALSDTKYMRLNKIINYMQTVYSTAKICPKNAQPGDNCTLNLTPELDDILSKSSDPEELKHVWLKWRDAIGPKCREKYQEYVDLKNEAARLNDCSDESEFWLGTYEDPDIKSKVDSLWNQVKPLYVQLHAYIRTKLKEKYGDIVSEKGPMPAHLLGDMWAQSWANLANFTLPYPNIDNDINLTESLKKKNYTVMGIFKTAEEFYLTINMTKMPENFWSKSVLVKQPNTEMVCHPTSWDLHTGTDFRITQCTDVSENYFYITHHEMGHVEYFIQYKDQPKPFRNGANEGFHEAIGDLISLSVQSTKHLERIGIRDKGNVSSKAVLNNLYRLGLFQVAFLPFAYLTDLWRWDVFSGKTKPQDYNCRWWKLRNKYQGVEPPVDRSEKDFDPVAKYHVVADVPYLRYFVAMILEYQFHKALCEKAGEYQKNNPATILSECDIYKNKEAGTLLKKMLAMGSSRPWPDALEVITGQREMDASGILEYFQPLHDWLKKENNKNKAYIGWEPSKKKCRRS